MPASIGAEGHHSALISGVVDHAIRVVLRCDLAEKYFLDRGISLKYAQKKNRVCKNCNGEWKLFLKYAKEIDRNLKKFKGKKKNENGEKTYCLFDLCHEWNALFFVDESNQTKTHKALDQLSKFLAHFTWIPENAPEKMREYLSAFGEDELPGVHVGNGKRSNRLPAPVGALQEPKGSKRSGFFGGRWKLVEFYYMSGFTRILPAHFDRYFEIIDIL